MNRLLLLFLFSLAAFFFSTTISAQGPGEDYNRVFYGGNIGLQFGDQTAININPLVGYRVTEKLAVGLTATYTYYHYTDPGNYYPSYSTNIYGGSLFSRYYILENIFAHIEGELLNLEVPDYVQQKYIRRNVFGLYLGGGYRQPMGANSSINILLLYNLNEDRYSPYQNPIIEIGFGFGI